MHKQQVIVLIKEHYTIQLLSNQRVCNEYFSTIFCSQHCSPQNLYSRSTENKHMKPPLLQNIFEEIPEQLPEEIFDCILKQNNLVIERIISNGHVTTDGEWYDQARDEWVILIQGEATLLFEKNRRMVRMKPGDYLLIPAHTRHRVEWTLPDFNTIWLAVHF
jgi:cupin 2 domain-containing protein